MFPDESEIDNGNVPFDIDTCQSNFVNNLGFYSSDELISCVIF